MAVNHYKRAYPAIAASVIGEGMAVVFASGGAAFGVHPATGLQTAPIAGIAEATAATVGISVNVVTEGVTKAWAAGSIANGQRVMVGSINGALIGFVSSPATAANPTRNLVGIALQNAGAGDRFAVLIQPTTSL